MQTRDGSKLKEAEAQLAKETVLKAQIEAQLAKRCGVQPGCMSEQT